MRPTRRSVLAAAAVSALGAAAPARAEPAVERPSERSGTRPLRLRRGVNTWPWFSLTREFPAPRTDYAIPEFQPQRPVPHTADLARLRAAGFDFLRLPVDPGPFLSAASGRHAALLEDLEAAVTRILAADLNVVVNVQANAATHYWTPDRLYGSDEAPLWPVYRDFVAELAGRLGAMEPQRIALEPVNEPPQSCGSAIWTGLQDRLLAGARRAAPSLTLIAGGACGSMVPGLVALDPAPLARFAPLLFTMHFYEPYLFSHQGAPWMREPVYRALNAVPWPGSAGTLERTLAAVRARMASDKDTSSADKERAYALTKEKLAEYFEARPDRRFIARAIQPLRAWAERHEVPARDILMGEFGALRSDARYVAAGAEDRARYIRDVREEAEAAGFAWAFWNLFDGMGIMDDSSRRLDPTLTAALGLSPVADP